MVKIILGFVSLACLLLTSACGRSETAGGETQAAAQGPAGRWERRYQDDVGQPYHEVLDLRADGTYVKDAPGWIADRGHYLIEDNVIAFRSDVNQRASRDMHFRIDKDGLTLSVSVPFPLSEPWTRATFAPNFHTVAHAGRALPQSLPTLMMSAYAALVVEWHEDAVPTSISLQELQSGGYEVTLRFFSPSSKEEYVIRMTENLVKTSIGDGSRSLQSPLPPDFMDLLPVLDLASRDGFTGALKKADVRTYGKFGPVWMIHTGAPTGASYSAANGARIREDVTGYIAQYNADWAAAGKMLRKALKQEQSRLQDSLAQLETKMKEERKNNTFSMSKSGDRLMSVVRSVQELANELENTSKTVTAGEYSVFSELRDNRKQEKILSLGERDENEENPADDSLLNANEETPEGDGLPDSDENVNSAESDVDRL